jgi:hypothetical protein
VINAVTGNGSSTPNLRFMPSQAYTGIRNSDPGAGRERNPVAARAMPEEVWAEGLAGNGRASRSMERSALDENTNIFDRHPIPHYESGFLLFGAQ